jgi:hypothetical protein
LPAKQRAENWAVQLAESPTAFARYDGRHFARNPQMLAAAFAQKSATATGFGAPASASPAAPESGDVVPSIVPGESCPPASDASEVTEGEAPSLPHAEPPKSANKRNKWARCTIDLREPKDTAL